MLSDKEEQESQALIPLVQDTVLFNGRPLVVVRLLDGQPGVVLRWICENLHISPAAQVERIKRTEVIADDLVYVRVQTDGGPQIMPTLILHAAPYWLATIDIRRMEKDDPRRLEILNYQRNAVDALYAWAQSPKALAAPTSLVSAEQISKPSPPAEDADLLCQVVERQHLLAHFRSPLVTQLGHIATGHRCEGVLVRVKFMLDPTGSKQQPARFVAFPLWRGGWIRKRPTTALVCFSHRDGEAVYGERASSPMLAGSLVDC